MNDPYDNAIDDKAILAQIQPLADADDTAKMHEPARSAPSKSESILQRLKAGEDLEVLYQETLAPGERELLRRVALTRQFDEALVDEVLRPGVSGGSREEVPFARLTSTLSVERWPRTSSYYMRDSGRRKWLRGHVLLELRDIEVRLAAYWKQRDAIEHLYHLLAVDQRAAEGHFHQLFAEADQRGDLSRCHDLICALRERSALLDPELARLFREKEEHLKARSEERNQRYLAYQHDRDQGEV